MWSPLGAGLARAQLGRNLKQIVTKPKSIIKLQKKQKESKLQTKHFKIYWCQKLNQQVLHSKRDSYTAEASGFMPVARWAQLHIISN